MALNINMREQDRDTLRLIDHCTTINLPTFADKRGSLTLLDREIATELLPFKPERVFWIHGADAMAVRGEHAHRTCWEMVCAVSGSFKLTLSDGREEKVFVMDSPNNGVIIPPMVWCRLEDFSPNAVCLTFASGDYDASGYINDFEELRQTNDEQE